MTVPLPAAPALPGELTLTDQEFRAVATLLYDVAGIHLTAGKEGLVRSRLAPRLRALGLGSVGEYLAHVEEDRTGGELTRMVDVLTTNKTSFFRESEHFAFLERTVLPALAQRGKPVRIWSAGCSSGEEPYTIAIVCRESLPDALARQTRILATDISTRILAKAKAATYAAETIRDVPPALVPRHFAAVDVPPVRGAGAASRQYRVADATRGLVTFARLNLMGDWPMRGPFDLIFCRNVMIYFDRATQERLVRRYTQLLAPGGHLLVGHSESLSALDHELRYVQPAVYQR